MDDSILTFNEILNKFNINNYYFLWYGYSIADQFIDDEGLKKHLICLKKNCIKYDRLYFIFKGIDELRCLFIGTYKIVCAKENKDNKNVCDCEIEKVSTMLDKFKNRMVLKTNNYSFYKNPNTIFEVDEIYHEDNRTISIFKSYNEIDLSFSELKQIINNKYEDYYKALSCIKGIYMIIDSNTGKQYIGSAYGEEGIYGRWKCYANTCHGDDLSLKELYDKKGPEYFNYMKFIILEILPLNISDKEIIERENFYKNRYLTKVFGLNKN